MAVPLGQAPRAGTSIAISRETLMRWVGARLGPADDTRVTWRGAVEVTVRSVTHELSGFSIEQTARASLTEWLKQRASRFSAEAIVAPRDLLIPPGQAQLRVRPLPSGDLIAARQRVWVDAFVDGEFVRAVPVDFSVAAYRPAWVAPQGLARGVPVAAQSLERREIDVAAVGRKILPAELPSLGDLRSRRAVAPGVAVESMDIEPVPAVTRGEQVTVLARSGDMELEARAEALQDGQVGQTVRVRTASGTAPVVAQVVSAGRVRVQP
jgi:flagellar basal body P-ring formation protein FlgA